MLPAIIGCDLFAARKIVRDASPACLLPLPACCHLLLPPATPAAAACFAKPRPEVAQVWRPSWWGFWAISPWPVWSLSRARSRLDSHVAKIPIGLASNGAMSGVTPTLAVRSYPSFLDSYQFPTSVEPLTPPTLTYARTMLAPTNMQESTLSHNEFALCLQSLLWPSSALSPCEFSTRMRALIPSPVPACLRSLPWPSLALSPSEFKSLYMRALTPTHVPTGLGARQAEGHQSRSRRAPQESNQSLHIFFLTIFHLFCGRRSFSRLFFRSFWDRTSPRPEFWNWTLKSDFKVRRCLISKTGKRRGKRGLLKNNHPEKSQIRGTLLRLMWRAAALGLTPLRLPRDRQSGSRLGQARIPLNTVRL